MKDTVLGAGLVLLSLLSMTAGRSPPYPGPEPEPEPEPTSFDMGFLALAPKVMTAGTTETVCFKLTNMATPIVLSIDLKDADDPSEYLASQPYYFMEFPFACLDLEVPEISGNQKKAIFEVTGYSEYNTSLSFQSSKKLWVKNNNWASLIQTDKSIYKPGQTVKFRMMTVDQKFRPDLSKVSKIWVETPYGVRMAQWLDVDTVENQGLVDLELPMTSDPPLGTWKIKALHRGRTVEQTFKVDEYVLPKFEIDIQMPSFILVNESKVEAQICAKYTYGQPVRGYIQAAFSVNTDGWGARPRATIRYEIEDTGKDGCQEIPVEVFRLELNSSYFSLWNAKLKVAVNFTELATGITLTKEEDTTILSQDPFKLKYQAPSTFKPGVPFYGKILVTYPDNRPSGGRRLTVTAHTNEGEVYNKILVSPASGVIDFAIKNISVESSTLRLYAVGKGYGNRPSTYDYRDRIHYINEPAASFSAKPQYSPSGSFIQVAPMLDTVDVGSVQTLTVDFTAREAEQESVNMNFLFMSRGNILRSDVNSIQHIDRSSPRRTARQAEEEVIDDEPSSSSDFSYVHPPNPTEEPIVYVQPGQLNTIQAKVTVTQEMVPVTRILVYFIRKDGEVVADSLVLNVRKVFENEVSMNFVNGEAKPGDRTTLRIQAAPGSLCGVGVVDKSVQLLGGDNQVKKEKVFSSLNKAQLSESGGELDPSDHCPKPRPWWGRRRRSIYYPPTESHEDASRAFKEMGLVFLTNIKVETRPCRRDRLHYYKFGGLPGPRREGVLAGPVALPVLFDAVPQETAEVFDEDDAEDVPPPEVEVRSYFPETFLWDLVKVGPEATEAEMEVEVPDTITDWVGSSVCTSTEYGIGVSDATSLRAFQPFFASYNLPYSVIRGEVVPVSVTVFNYLSECLVVELTLQDSADFVLKDKSNVQRMCVCGAESKTAEFNVSFSTLGMVPIEVHAISVEDTTALCGNDVLSSTATGFTDGIRRELLVEAEGVEEEYTINNYFCPEDTGIFTSVNNIGLPINVVKDSQKAKITLTGDLMGPTLSNLDKLLRIPTGCGEQNMIGFVPNIFVMQYLESTDQLTPAIADQAKNNMKIGYQRELNYRRNDNSYSAFGMSDPEGSTWLTAFVVRSFGRAQQYIYIDQEDVDRSINFLRERQDDVSGCFQASGKLCHKGMSGGVNSGLTLTAYIVITLLEVGVPTTDPAVQNGLRCLTDGLPSLTDTYTITQMAYALSLAESPELPDVMTMLESAAMEEDGVKFWESNRPVTTQSRYGTPAQDIEMTSYALLAYLQQSEASEAIVAGNPVSRWIMKQRNSQGGFSSTQDTVVGLQALANYAELAFSGGVSIQLKVRTHPQRFRHVFQVNTANRLIMQELTLDAQNVPTRLTFEGTGLGCALLQTAVSYNVIPKKPTTPAFTISYDAREIETTKRCYQYAMRVCTSYTGTDEVSNMALMRVKMQTGFIPVKSSLTSSVLKEQTDAFRKVELEGKMITFYFDELTSEETCLVFKVQKDIEVKDVKDGAVTIVDYYEQSLTLSEMVRLPCPEIPVYLDPTFKEPEPEPLEPLDPLVPIEPLDPHGPHREPLVPFPREPLEPWDVGRVVGGGRQAGPEGGLPDPLVLAGVDITDFNQCPPGRVFADGVKKCIRPVGDDCPGTRCESGSTCVETSTGSQCVDLDECSRYPDICKGGAVCTNTVGGYLCAVMDCGVGYQMSADGHCEDVNECEVNNICGLFEECSNYEGGYNCQKRCIAGFRLNPDLECEDIDECSEDPEICGPGNLCANTLGSFACAIVDCGLGFIKNAEGRCIDVNECLEPDLCPPGSICNNLPGGFVCVECTVGYRATTGLEPTECIDIDECEEGSHKCSSDQQCINTPGWYYCTVAPCHLPMETGMCRALFRKFGFNTKTQICEEFIYGGCDGNDNRFDSLAECTDTCQTFLVEMEPPVLVVDPPVEPLEPEGPILAVDPLDPEPPVLVVDPPVEPLEPEGPILAVDPMDPEPPVLVVDPPVEPQEPDVELVDPPVEPVGPAAKSPICLQPLEVGKCKAAFPKFGYDVSNQTCKPFLYGGCGGNDNRFDSEEECLRVCQVTEQLPQETPAMEESKPVETKAGLCPVVDMSTMEGACTEECFDDYTCPDDQKCCRNGCGQMCMPAYHPIVHEYGQCPPMSDNGTCSQECTVDGDCGQNSICCFTGCGRVCSYPIIIEPMPQQPGRCPMLPENAQGPCADLCMGDYDCGEGMKCCSNGCGLECLAAIDIVIPEPEPEPYPEPEPETGMVKPGECPVVEPSGFGICVQECQDDSGCAGDAKCCANGCGQTCMDPIINVVDVPRIPMDCPHCLTDLSDLPDDITELVCTADLMMVVKWRSKDNRVRLLRDLILNEDISQPSRLLDMEENCACSLIANDERFIIVGETSRIVTGRGKARGISLGINSLVIRNEAKLKKTLNDIRASCS